MTVQGSKASIAKFITPILQKCIDENNITTFIDCCCGGANIIKNIQCQNKIGIDNNPYLIALLQEMQKPDFVFPEHMTREDWDRCKNNQEPRDWYVGLCSIFCSYFTRGFNGGYCNHLHPGNRNYYEGRVKTAKKDIPLLKNINFINNDFSIIQTYKNCVIYCDPPYKNTTKYDYSKNFNYDLFWEVIRKTSNNNYVFISEQQAPEDFISIWTNNTRAIRPTNEITIKDNLFIYKIGKSYKYFIQGEKENEYSR